MGHASWRSAEANSLGTWQGTPQKDISVGNASRVKAGKVLEIFMAWATCMAYCPPEYGHGSNTSLRTGNFDYHTPEGFRARSTLQWGRGGSWKCGPTGYHLKFSVCAAETAWSCRESLEILGFVLLPHPPPARTQSAGCPVPELTRNLPLPK